ncbi:MAG: hypothetical protein HY719_02170 [Planctomycetes bacterium]|nr:hypothetical protein [Planctomycetota bacterium]
MSLAALPPGAPRVPLRFDPRFVEEAVFLVLRGHAASGRSAAGFPDSRAAYRRAYEAPPGPERDARFAETSAALFADLALDRPFRQAVDEEPRLEALAEIQVRPAASAGEECADLFVRAATPQPDDGAGTRPPDERRAAIFLLVSRLAEPEALATFLERELAHVADMLDPRFGYDGDGPPGEVGESPAARNLFRERYRALWTISIEARLERRGRVPSGGAAAALAAFEERNGPLAPREREALTSPSPAPHRLLAEMAGRRPLRSGASGVGGICPVCSFHTFDWGPDPKTLSADVRRALDDLAPSRSAGKAVCRRCLEVAEVQANDAALRATLPTISIPEPPAPARATRQPAGV